MGGVLPSRRDKATFGENGLGWRRKGWDAGKGGKGFGGKSGGGKGWQQESSWSSPYQSWGGKDKGKGKGKFTCPPDRKVWIGGLPAMEATDKELNQALREHMKQAGN